MSQRIVEISVGKLVTDDSFRRWFYKNRETACTTMEALGLTLTPIEREALLALDLQSCERFSRLLDPRIRKIDLDLPESKP